MTLKETLAENLRRELVSRQITKSELARRCGWAPPRITELLTGRYSPTLDTVERVAEALGVLPGTLLLPPPVTSAVA